MVRILSIFIVLLLAMWLGIQLSHDPGYLLIAINHWTIETTLGVAIIGLLLSFILLHLLLLLLNRLAHFPEKYQHWKIKRRAQKAQAKTRQGLIEFSEGYWQSAKNHLIKALPDTDAPLLNYLTAARAAQELGDYQLRDRYLREAQQSMPEAKVAVELTQAQLQLANQQWEQALATLRHLQSLTPHHPYVLKLLMYLYKEVRDWPQLINLLPELKRNQIVTAETFERLRRYTYLQAMSDLIKFSQTNALDELVNQLPKPLKHDPELMACYCQYLLQNNQNELAESILRRCLRRQYHDELITLYGQFYIDEKQLQFAETLLKKYPNSPALYLCLGRLSAANHLWGKAKTYIENSLTLAPSPEAYIEIGKLYERLGEQTQACQAYREGLNLAQKNKDELVNYDHDLFKLPSVL
ncbi:heme biosynthesis HemY N-terminal domain-containing protein [Legionella beliardensis]|uniref:heme biosynthesis HemY N-terminal domain-containing protein n=1 Tax=Legionella beliardensis TaxID=91822 RepID=UPI000E1BFB50|nr:heme biosynthesis HemY N-terminal domain-containing protein [Legionella beliardensis]